MTRSFAYIRVSTARQGEKGVSLQEQRSAIERYALRSDLTITEWFEERETAAKRGRPVFMRMLRRLRKREAVALIVHKIDRSARNLRDWADLGELIDAGLTVYFAHESLDLASRGGRLSADIQAVVAADYVRNLREEARKGFYGRLRQGLWPLAAPIGYLDRGGGGKVKEVDVERAPFVRQAFELYASGRYSLRTLAEELHLRGLRNTVGNPLTLTKISTMLNNPFYCGLLRVRRTGELFNGKHRPLIPVELFKAVQERLRGKTQARVIKHNFPFRRLVACRSCGRSVVGSLRKGHVYYRCHQKQCPTTCVREEVLLDAVRAQLKRLAFTAAQKESLKEALNALTENSKRQAATNENLWKARLGQVQAQQVRLTDALIAGLVDKEVFRERSAALLLERRAAEDHLTSLQAGGDSAEDEPVRKCIELAESALLSFELADASEKHELIELLTSNRSVSEKNVVVELQFPFSSISNALALPQSGYLAERVRTNYVRSSGHAWAEKLLGDLLIWAKVVKKRSANSSLLAA